MSIGLYDVDFVNYRKVPFNLEIMKLATYYKKQREIVLLSKEFCPERFQKFFIRKDWDDGVFESALIAPNITYGGHAFSGDKYMPLELDIERQTPDVMPYWKHQAFFVGEKKGNEVAFKMLLSAAHGRISLDNKTVWSDFESTIVYNNKTATLFLHDFDLQAIEGSFDTVSYLLRQIKRGCPKKHALLGTKFPIQVDDFDCLLKWGTLTPTSKLFNIQYNGILSNNQLAELVQRQKMKSFSRQLFYNVTSTSSSENEFIKNYLPQICEQATILRRNDSQILLKYNENLFLDPRWQQLFALLQKYIFASPSVGKGFARKLTLYDYVTNKNIQEYRHLADIASLDEIRDIFAWVKSISPEAHKIFYYLPRR